MLVVDRLPCSAGITMDQGGQFLVAASSLSTEEDGSWQ